MKLLASDFDNTLLFHNQMKDDDVNRIKQFQKDGNLFGVCTGRSFKGIDKASQPYQLNYDFYILLSGAYILNKQKEIIFEKQIPMNLVIEIFDYSNHQEASVVYQNEMYIVTSKKEHDYFGIYLESFKQLQTDSVSAFSFHFKKDEIKKATKLTQMINKKYGHMIEAFQNNEHIDLAPKGCSKGNGIKIIKDYFQIDDQDIYAIGDSTNDLPMLDVVKNSYTFTYAKQNVQKHANHIVESLADCIQDIEKYK